MFVECQVAVKPGRQACGGAAGVAHGGARRRLQSGNNQARPSILCGWCLGVWTGGWDRDEHSIHIVLSIVLWRPTTHDGHEHVEVADLIVLACGKG